MKKKQFLLLLLSLTSLFSCSVGPTNPSSDDTPTSGRITVSCDESLKPIIEAEEMVFESLYPNAKVDLVYTSESDAIQLVMKDSARMAIVTRKMYPAEEEALHEQKISHARYTKLAIDAIAFILHPSNHDTLFTVDQMRDVLSGKINSWDQLKKGSNKQKIQVVFDHPASGAVRYLKDSLLHGKDLGKSCFALKSNQEVITYVENNPNSIGIIGISWISDPDDSLVRYFMKKINVADIVPPVIKMESLTYKPIQGNIAIRQYPFCREVFAVSREAKTGLATGFISFMAGDQGQRIVLKSGLVPARAPIRIVNLY